MRFQKKARSQQRNIGALVSLDKDALKRVVGGVTGDEDPMGGGPGSGGHPHIQLPPVSSITLLG